MGKNKSFIISSVLLSAALLLPATVQALTCSSQQSGTFECFGNTYVCGNSCITDAAAAAKAALCPAGSTLDCSSCACTNAPVAGTVSWDKLINFPANCAAGQFVVGLGPTFACGTPTIGGDNLGNHIATQLLNMNNFDINNIKNATSTGNVKVGGAGAFGGYSIDGTGIKVTTPSLYADIIQTGAGSNNMGSGSINSQLLCIKGVCKTGWDAALPPSGSAGGDLSGTYPNPTVAKIQNRSVASTPPTNGQVLKWNNATSAWEPATDAGTAYSAGAGLSLASTVFSLNTANANTWTDIQTFNGTTAIQNTNGIFYLDSNDDVQIHIDKNNNGINYFKINNGGNTTVFQVDESGTLNSGIIPWARLTGIPTNSLAAAGVILAGTGNPNKVWGTDASGNPSWQASASSLPTGTNGQTLRNNGTAWIADSNIYNTGSSVGIGTSALTGTFTVQANSSVYIPAVVIKGPLSDVALNLDNSMGNGSNWRVDSTGIGTNGTSGYGTGNFAIIKETGGNSPAQLIIAGATGNVGIGLGLGVPAAGNKLEVNGNIKAHNNVGATQYCDQNMANCKSITSIGALSGGSTNYITKWTSPTAIGNSIIFDNGANVGIGTAAPVAPERIRVVGTDNSYTTNILNILALNATQGVAIGYDEIRKSGSNLNGDLKISAKGTGNLILQNLATGNVGIGSLVPSSKLQIYDASAGPLLTITGGSKWRGIKITDLTPIEKWFAGSDDLGNYTIRKDGTYNNIQIDTSGNINISNGTVNGVKTAFTSVGSLKMDKLAGEDWSLATAQGGVVLAASGNNTCTQVCSSHGLTCQSIIIQDASTFCSYKPDYNSSGNVDAVDVQVQINCESNSPLGCSTCTNTASSGVIGPNCTATNGKKLDINGDGVVDSIDLRMVLNWGLNICSGAGVNTVCDTTGGIRNCICD